MKKLLLINALLLLMTLKIMAGDFKTVYLYGVVISFNDSTVYLTEIQPLDSAWIEKNGFLYGRDTYSWQLHDYMTVKGADNPVVATFFADKKKDIEKKYIKSKRRYTNPKYSYILKYITNDEFKYELIKPDEQAMKKDSDSKKEQRKKAKEAKKARKKANKDMKKGIRPDIDKIPEKR